MLNGHVSAFIQFCVHALIYKIVNNLPKILKKFEKKEEKNDYGLFSARFFTIFGAVMDNFGL